MVWIQLEYTRVLYNIHVCYLLESSHVLSCQPGHDAQQAAHRAQQCLHGPCLLAGLVLLEVHS